MNAHGFDLDLSRPSQSGVYFVGVNDLDRLARAATRDELCVRRTDLSGCHDKDELLRWAGGFTTAPKTAFIVHGEPAGSDALRHALEEQRRWKCLAPEHRQTVELS